MQTEQVGVRVWIGVRARSLAIAIRKYAAHIPLRNATMRTVVVDFDFFSR